MSTMNISLPESLKKFVNKQVAQHGFGTSSEYVRQLIRQEQERSLLREKLLAGARSAPAREMDSQFFAELRRRARSKR